MLLDVGLDLDLSISFWGGGAFWALFSWVGKVSILGEGGIFLGGGDLVSMVSMVSSWEVS
jgi:hypothetical protein